MFAPYDYAKQNLLQTNLPPLSEGHLLGTDQVGRDLFSRLVTGVRISLIVGFGVTAISMIVGTAAGAIAGYRRGWTDSLISGIVEFTWGFPSSCWRSSSPARSVRGCRPRSWRWG